VALVYRNFGPGRNQPAAVPAETTDNAGDQGYEAPKE
jgi:hypothetical protein